MIKIMLEYLQSLRQIKKSFGEGQYIFHRDDRVKSMFLVVTGTAQLIRHQEDGSSVVLQRAAHGSVLAEASLFTSDYHCDAIAASPLEVCLVSRKAVQQLFYSNQDFAKAWVTHLGREVRGARLRTEILSLKTVAERLDAWLADKGYFPEKGVWKSVAYDIGVSPEALYREIALRNPTSVKTK